MSKQAAPSAPYGATKAAGELFNPYLFTKNYHELNLLFSAEHVPHPRDGMEQARDPGQQHLARVCAHSHDLLRREVAGLGSEDAILWRHASFGRPTRTGGRICVPAE